MRVPRAALRITSSVQIVLLAAAIGRAQGPDVLFGEWETRPDPGTSEYVRATCTIEPVESDGDDVDAFRVTYDLVGTRGGVTHLEWTGRLDGADYRVQGLDYVMTNAYTRVGARRFAIVTKVNGRMTTTAETTVSGDGQTMTTVTRGWAASGEEVETSVTYQRLR